MEKFVYEYATKVYFGEGAAREHLAAAVSAYGPNVMLAYGGGSVKKNGIYDEVKKILEDAGNAVEALADFIKECGLPTKMGELKSKTEITPELLRNVADTCNVIKCNPRELDREEIYEILMECM
ncbi:MAG TPA: iron-containing alcohol dehydrogenase [Candidatus Pullilachnospira stercoravium]|uniref:Iron-containing alcohol dehydrogenase n=1 Tax=Candidatus Pullilachnospira stercoravium TaxID=2840913 RepID=A0A9D1NRL3_9FIRM|nr:iron-containing alcohol dehydrogenase [Candidatus Pullilachnospira stercoravium]